jgi:hypothetical protein
MTSSPAPGSRVHIPSTGRWNSKRLSMHARRVCRMPPYWHIPTHPRPLHSSLTPPFPPRAPYCSNMLAAPRFLLQEAQSSTAEIQRLRSRTAGCIRGREALPPHAGSSPVFGLHGSQVYCFRIPTETRHMFTSTIPTIGLHCPIHYRHTTYLCCCKLNFIHQTYNINNNTHTERHSYTVTHSLRVRVTLQLTVSMSWCRAQSGTFDQRSYFFVFESYCLVIWGRPL